MPSPPAEPFVTGLVLGAGGSKRLGQPKQLLPYGDDTLLGHVLQTARGCGFQQLVVALGGAVDEVRERIDLSGAQVVVNTAYGEGCSSSIAAALPRIDPRCQTIVLMLGDQPGVARSAVGTLIAGRGDAALAVCRYENGRGHPFAFGRPMFAQLSSLHGDKAVWKLLDGRPDLVHRIPVDHPLPLDVDTWDDYEAALWAVTGTHASIST